MFDPLDFAGIANGLGEETPLTEAHIRTAVNRAYYAMHLKAAWGLEKAELFSPDGSAADHSGVIRTLRANRRSAADKLSTLRTLRELVDYKIDQNVPVETWVEAKELLEDIIMLLEPDWN